MKNASDTLNLEIVFQNEAWCAAIKPAGMLSVPSRLGNEDARPCFGIRLEEQLGTRLWPVHRLDIEVAGLLLFAKDATAHREANTWFEKGLVRKRYAALSSALRKEPDPRLHPGHALLLDPKENLEASWSAPLVSGKRRSFVAAHGKESLTKACWQRHEHHKDKRLWRLEPLTGRSHQLRVHMALAGFPIAGDVLYGSELNFEGDGIALQACELRLSAISNTSRRGLPESLICDARF